jgi:putative ABC transport system ATP-binding protein
VTPLFEFRNLSVSIAGSEVLHQISLVIPDSKLTVIAGASGSGKSTLLRCCNRLEVPSSGTVSYLGQEIASLDPLLHRRRVAMVFQHPATFPGSVLANLQAACPELSVQGAEQLCDRVSIKRELLDREADSLSGGEAQRMVIARALAAQPQVLLADEPTSALDGDATERMEELALALLDQGIAVVWVTHDRAQISRLAQHLVVLKSGELLFSGSADDPDAASAIDESWFNKEE